jgi:sugar phosphate isomerase/epimerase
MGTCKVQIGCKLPLGWQSADDWPDLARRANFLSHLGEMGFDYVEFGVGSLESADERHRLQEQAGACGEAGLGMALHPYMGGRAKIAGFERGPQCRRALGRLLEAAAEATEQVPGTVTLVFHPAEDDYDPAARPLPEVRSELLRTSRLFARELENRISALDRGVLAALEHQVPPAPGENLVRTGDTAEELLQVVEGTDLPLCWDTGHYLLSMDRHGQPARPPEVKSPTFTERREIAASR